mmetsp:Transcript_60934/g.188706  ORF Transcript_60934/g.188706 Transcript_60934/m.188706 type:complete len:226 (-) Transcript_60934:245-922(-)
MLAPSPVDEVRVIQAVELLDGHAPGVPVGDEDSPGRQRVGVQCSGDDAAEALLIVVVEHVQFPQLAIAMKLQPYVRVRLHRDVGDAVQSPSLEGETHSHLPRHPDVVPSAEVRLNQQRGVSPRVVSLCNMSVAPVGRQAGEYRRPICDRRPVCSCGQATARLAGGRRGAPIKALAGAGGLYRMVGGARGRGYAPPPPLRLGAPRVKQGGTCGRTAVRHLWRNSEC